MTEPSRQVPPMTLKPPPQGKRSGPSFWQWVAIAIGVLIVIGIANSGSSDNKKPTATRPAAPFPATSAQTRAFVTDHLKNDEQDGGRVRKATCRHGTCEVLYDTGDLSGIDTPHELLDQQRDIFRKLFSVPTVRVVFLAAYGQIETIGGKTRTDQILEVMCRRSAADQIDWDNVDVDGMKALCMWTPFVKL